MKRIIPFIIMFVLAAVACSTKAFSSRDLIGEWRVYEDTNIRYTFTNDTLLYIDDMRSEGDPYTYKVKKDTLFYRSLDDNSVQWLVLDTDCSDNTLFVHNETEHFILRKSHP